MTLLFEDIIFCASDLTVENFLITQSSGCNHKGFSQERGRERESKQRMICVSFSSALKSCTVEDLSHKEMKSETCNKYFTQGFIR